MERVTDADAARAIERQMQDVKQRVQQRGVMEYLKPLGDGGRKDVNKQFLTSTIRSVDLHNRRHEEEKCWKLRDLEQKLDERRGSRRSRSRSRSRERSTHRSRRKRSRSNSPAYRSTHQESRRRRRSRSRSRSRNSSRTPHSPRRAAGDELAEDVDERELWAAKKAEKTKQMWEKMYSTTGTVMVQNAPDFSSSDDSDDEDERVVEKKTLKSSRRAKEKKEKHSKKAKKKEKKAKKRSS